MKRQLYKIICIALLLFGTMLHAQKFDKKYTQEFKVNNDVVIDVNTRHTDIEIETWNKNKVTIEATIEIEGASKEKAEEIIKNWKFKAMGNDNEIDVTSKSNRLFVELPHNLNESIAFELPEINEEIDFILPEVSVGNLAILDSFPIVLPDMSNFQVIVVPEIQEFDLSFDSLSFDYEKYKNDENYLKEWQEEMKKNLGKMRVELKENSVRIKEHSAKLKEELKAAQEERKKALKKYAEHRKETMKIREQALKERAEERKEMAKVRREVQEKRREELAKKRVEIKNILIDREKIKIKRIIKIMAPKEAKFNMNVRYGSMSFPN